MCRGPALSRELVVAGAGFVRLHHLLWTGSDPVIVLLHPNRTNARVWDHVVACSALPNAFVAVDHRGHGRSEWPPSGYGLDDYVADDIAFLEKLDRGPVILVGAATGGTVGLLLATRRPDLVAALAVVDPGLSLDPGINAAVQREIATGREYGSFEAARDAMPFSASWSEAVRDHFADHYLYEVDAGRWAPRYRPEAVSETEAALEADLWHLIRPACPVLAVRGARSRVFDRPRLWRLAETVDDCLLVEVPGADHRVGQDNPRGLAAVLDSFVRSLADVQGSYV